MKKIIGFLLKIVLVAILLIVMYFALSGFIMYKKSISNTTIQKKIEQIQLQDNYVKIEDIPKYYWQAVVAIEDKRFFDHGPIDYISTIRAVVINIRDGRFSEGGSSITQQLAKNIFFSQEKKIERKVAELFMAYELEKIYSKEDILELYMNVIYYGDGYTGIYDASVGYFEKHPSELTMYEATLLAGVPNAPSIYAISNGNKYIYERQKEIVECMSEQGYLSADDVNSILEIEK